MRLALYVCALAVGVSLPRDSYAQDDLKDVRTARLTFAQVDSIVFLFGVDTAVLRRRITERLADARIVNVDDLDAPLLEVTITVLQPSSVRTESSATVAMRLLSPRSSRLRPTAVVWAYQSPRLELSAWRMLPAVLAAAVDRVVDELIQAKGRAQDRVSQRAAADESVVLTRSECLTNGLHGTSPESAAVRTREPS